MKWSDLIEKVPTVFKNKYVITIVLFLLWLIFFDANNIISRIRERMVLSKLQDEKGYYLEKIESDSAKLMQLRTDNENLEKFAREQYRMKNPDEDIYVIITPEEEKENFKVTRQK